MYVATNRQKKNAFAKRADMQRQVEEKAKPTPRATPTPVAEPKPDIEAMKAAAAEAAALIHVGDTETMTADFEAETEYALADPERAAALRDAVTATEPEPEPDPEPKRGRPMSAAVAKRNATILQLLAENPEGLSKPQLASELKEKEANVYSSLRKLQSDGKVRTENTEGTKYLWYLV
jgi:hypothetical protein